MRRQQLEAVADAINRNQRQRSHGVPFLSQPRTYSVGDLPACPTCGAVPNRIRVGGVGDVVSFPHHPIPVTFAPCGHLFSITIDEADALAAREPSQEQPMSDTGRRCPRCDCPDGHEQCDHCKVCEHARPVPEQPMNERPIRVICAALHTDAEGNTIPCPDGDRDFPAPQKEDNHPQPPSEDELNSVLPVLPDPRQPAYDAVYDYIRRLGGYLPPDPSHRNAVIWRAVHAALGATPVGRCMSSHCVEGDHMLLAEGEPS